MKHFGIQQMGNFQTLKKYVCFFHRFSRERFVANVMAELVVPAEQRNPPLEQEDQSDVDTEKEDTNQTSVLSDPKSFIEKISSFFNHQTLSDVVIQVLP